MESMLKKEGDPRFNDNAAFFDTIEYVGDKSHGWEAWEEFHKAAGKDQKTAK
jgi:hypothetical protein